MEQAGNDEYKQGLWTPWARVLCPEDIGRENIPSAPSDEKWRQWATPAPVGENNAVTFCDGCGNPVQLEQNVAEEHTLVYELRAMGLDAFMAQTGGMNSACMVNISDEMKTGNEIEDPDQMYICCEPAGDKRFFVEVLSEEGIVAEVDWSEMSFSDKGRLMAWISENSEKLAPLEPTEEKTKGQLMQEAKDKLSALHPEEKRSLDDLIAEAKEKAAGHTPDPDRPPHGASKKSPGVER